MNADHNQRKMQIILRVLDAIFIVLLIVDFFIISMKGYYLWHDQNCGRDERFMRRMGIFCILIGITQAVVGIVILRSLRNEFEEFYTEHYRKIIVASSLLLLSNCITGLYLYNAY